MKSVVVNVELDREDRSYRSGDKITGRVVVSSIKDFECESLVLECSWLFLGIGENLEEDIGTVESIELEKGFRIAAGESRSWYFAFDAPAGPVSYEGKHNAFRWVVTATAKQPPRFFGGKDPYGGLIFELQGVPGQTFEHVLGDGKIIKPNFDSFRGVRGRKCSDFVEGGCSGREARCQISGLDGQQKMLDRQ